MVVFTDAAVETADDWGALDVADGRNPGKRTRLSTDELFLL